MLPNPNGAASAPPTHPQRRPVASTLFGGILLFAMSAATPSMAQHGGHGGHGSHATAKPQRTTAKRPVVERRSTESGGRHAHAAPGARQRGVAETPATREFKVAHARMMRNMDQPYTGDADVDFRVQMIPHHQAAIDMAQVAMRHSKNPWTRQFAEAVIVEQQREIAEMQAWLSQRGARVPPGGGPTHIIGPNSFLGASAEPGSRAELRGQSWAPGSGIPAP